MKTCTKCKVDLPETDFYKRKKSKTGLSPQCKKCSSSYITPAAHRTACERYVQRNRAKVLASKKKWKENNKEQIRRAAKEYYDRTKPEYIVSKARHIKHYYGMTIDEFFNILKDQDGKCAICNMVFALEEGKAQINTPHVDHVHDSGAIRGLLCRRCNQGIGNFQDSVTSLCSAILYLTKASAIKGVDVQ